MIDKRQFSIVIIAFRLLQLCYAAISTELVEEWGCYDSEFKLTCNDIDSKIGVLEATFNPHCESSNSNSKCLLYDEDSIMKIIAQSLSRKAETHEEEYAARKLLDVLRNARLKEQEREENEAKTSEFRSESAYTTEVYDPSTFNDQAENISMDYEMSSARSDKKMLRDSLEKLISLYLTKLREDSIEYGNFDDNHVRERRDLSTRVSRRKKLVPGKCKIMRRRIGTLDRIEIEQALRNLTNTEFNIRKLLNYRCSGKNHCSFIFSTDHPYAMFWDEGTVHIKYYCMDNFRLNKYCGELLQVGNEDWDLSKNLNWTEIANNDKSDENSAEDELNGPRMEALRHREMSFYQVKSVKIIKPDKKDTPTTATLPQANITEIKFPKQLEKDKTAQNKVYSQDFRLFKVLPNVVEKPEPDIEKIKKEEYVFHKKEETQTSDSEIETNEIDSVLQTSTIKTQTQMRISSSIIAPTIEISSTINSDEQINLTQPIPMTTTSISDEMMMITERKDFDKTVKPTESVLNATDLMLTNETETVFSIDSPEKEKYGREEESKEIYIDSYDDDDDDEDYDIDSKTSNIKYKYSQHTLPSSTLLTGFIANPGYPMYYIGSDRDCKWKIKIAKGQRMSLTVMDLHLRIDDYCKDSLEIIDLEYKKSLWKGCSELTRLIQIESLSHQIEIVLKTKSKNIYPKRGFLIHYKAIGCIVPQVPENVKIVNRLENLIRYSCEANHVFPDSSQSDRAIICINESWNDTITKCVAIRETLGRQINLVNEQLRREGRMSNESETLNDILVPIFIISGLFLLNAVVFIIILRYRKQRRQENFDRELADL